MSYVYDYLADVAEPRRAALERVLQLARELVPGVTEGKSYAMPALLYRGKPLLGFLAARRHLSLFPFSGSVVDAVRPQLEGFDLSKGTIRFSEIAPIPDGAIAEILRLRMAEIDAKLA